MSILKIDATDGSLVWKMAYTGASGAGGEGFSQGSDAIAETVAFTSDGGFVIGGSIKCKDCIDTMTFKSGGMMTDGSPFIAKVSAADAAATSAPSSFEWTFELVPEDLNVTDLYADYYKFMGSARSLRIDSSDNVYAIVGTASSMVKLNGSGVEQWVKYDTTEDKVQMNDLELVSDGIILAGHRYVTLTDEPNNCSINPWKACGTIWGHAYKIGLDGEN